MIIRFFLEGEKCSLTWISSAGSFLNFRLKLEKSNTHSRVHVLALSFPGRLLNSMERLGYIQIPPAFDNVRCLDLQADVSTRQELQSGVVTLCGPTVHSFFYSAENKVSLTVTHSQHQLNVPYTAFSLLFMYLWRRQPLPLSVVQYQREYLFCADQVDQLREMAKYRSLEWNCIQLVGRVGTHIRRQLSWMRRPWH